MGDVSCRMCVDFNCCHPKCSVAITSFAGNLLSEILWDQHAYSTCSGLKTLYVCNFYNPDEGDATSLENFERSLQ